MDSLNVPNLDTIDDVKELNELSNVFLFLSRFARHKASAVRARLNGRLNLAIENENICDSYYKSLPESVRW
jgi:hypothetical protein